MANDDNGLSVEDLAVEARRRRQGKQGWSIDHTLRITQTLAWIVGLIVATTLYIQGGDTSNAERVIKLEAQYESVCTQLTDLKKSVADVQSDVKLLLRQGRPVPNGRE